MIGTETFAVLLEVLIYRSMLTLILMRFQFLLNRDFRLTPRVKPGATAYAAFDANEKEEWLWLNRVYTEQNDKYKRRD